MAHSSDKLEKCEGSQELREGTEDLAKRENVINAIQPLITFIRKR